MKLPILLTALAVMATGSISAQTEVFQKHARTDLGRTKINPHIAQKKFQRSARKAAELPKGTLIYEDFESWDESAEWTPAGWTFDHKQTPTGHPGWRAYGYDAYDPENYPSTTYIYFMFNEPVDEWLISPEFTAESGMILKADVYNSGSYYFDIDAELFTSEINTIEKVNDFKINITTDDGATWTELYSFADELLTHGYTKAFEYWDRTGWETIQLPLDAYEGKKAKIAFQIVGNPVGMPDKPESQSSGVDNILVGYPQVEVSYTRPLGALFYGLNEYDSYVPGTFMVVPAYSPVTYPFALSNTPEAEYEWTVDHTDGIYSVDGAEDLVVVYGTNHESEATSRNNIYDTPVLTGSGDKYSTTQYSHPGFVQAGGRGEYQIYWTDTNEYEWLQLGLTVADPQVEYTSTYAEIAVPYFGYNQESDRFWTTRTFDITNAEYDRDYANSKENWSELQKYGNLYYTTEQPIVIENIRTIAYGSIKGNAKFKAEIYFLSDDYEVSEEPDYSFEISGKDVKILDRGTDSYILVMNFPLDEPLAISKKDCMAFFIAISGFHDAANVNYFSPEMSAYDNPDGLALGWAGVKTCWGGVELPVSWMPVVHQTELTEPEGEQFRSFYIMIDGCYPWLQGEETLQLDDNGQGELTLDSYYAASDLQVEAPSWLSVEKSGRYGSTKLSFKANTDKDVTATVKVTAPGVSKTLSVINGEGGVDGVDVVEVEFDGAARYYNLQGIETLNPTTGLYIQVKNGKSRKVYLR